MIDMRNLKGNIPPSKAYDSHEGPRRSPLAHKQIVSEFPYHNSINRTANLIQIEAL